MVLLITASVSHGQHGPTGGYKRPFDVSWYTADTTFRVGFDLRGPMELLITASVNHGEHGPAEGGGG